MELASDAPAEGYPFTVPVVSALRRSALTFPAGVTFLVGENGCGKSTLIEALAVAAGMNAEGGSQNYRFSTRRSESELAHFTSLTWRDGKPRSKFFLRAESFYNMATETERLGQAQIEAMGGTSLHERSHGESFVDLMRYRFQPGGLYILDEPEAALSPRGCMAVVALMAQLVRDRCQLIVATHSPILISLPGATIYEIDDDGEISTPTFDDAMPVRLTRQFLARPEYFLSGLTA